MNFRRISRIAGIVALGMTVGVLGACNEVSRKDRNTVAHATDEAGSIETLKAELAPDKFEQLNKAVAEKSSSDSIKSSILWKELADQLPECKASLKLSGYWENLADCLQSSTSLNQTRDLAKYLADKVAKAAK